MGSKAGLTDEERAAVAALKRLAKRWPKSLWLFSASGTLHVMRKTGGGRVDDAHRGGADPDASIWSTRDIDNDGGDW